MLIIALDETKTSVRWGLGNLGLGDRILVLFSSVIHCELHNRVM